MKIIVKLTPKASRNEVQDISTDLLGETILKACVTTVPEKGKANKALIDLLAKYFRIPKSDIQILRGTKSRTKVIEIQGVTESDLKIER